MSILEGTIEHDGAALHYLDWGGDGPPMVLIHATGFMGAIWRPIAEQLAKTFRVVALDQRGHGDSPPSADGYSFELFADDLQRLIDTLELEAPLAAGHSSGGTTIVAHAARNPGVISRAVLIEPILPRPEWYQLAPANRSPNRMAEGARKRRAVWPSSDALFESYRSRPPFETWREDVLRLYADEGTRERADGQVELKCAPEDEAQLFEAVTRIDPWAMASELRSPTLILWGAESHLKDSVRAHAQKAFPKAQTLDVPESTHFLPQERPDEVVRHIEEFLAD